MTIAENLVEQIQQDIEEQETQAMLKEISELLPQGLFQVITTLLNKCLPDPGGCILSEDELIEILTNLRACLNITGFDVEITDVADGAYNISLVDMISQSNTQEINEE